jgi:hypothetical protein
MIIAEGVKACATSTYFAGKKDTLCGGLTPMPPFVSTGNPLFQLASLALVTGAPCRGDRVSLVNSSPEFGEDCYFTISPSLENGIFFTSHLYEQAQRSHGLTLTTVQTQDLSREADTVLAIHWP